MYSVFHRCSSSCSSGAAACSAVLGAVDSMVDALSVTDLNTAAVNAVLTSLDQPTLVDVFHFAEAHRFLQALLRYVGQSRPRASCAVSADVQWALTRVAYCGAAPPFLL